MNLQSAFLFWPVRIAGVLHGWCYGTYTHAHGLGHRELLEKGRLRWGRRHKGTISDAQVQKSFLYHEALGVALQTDRVLLESFQLDEQRYCEPMALVPSSRAKEAFMAFLNLTRAADEDAVRYIEEFGLFDEVEVDADGNMDSRIPRGVQRICKQFQNEHKDPFAVSLADFWAVRDTILGLWNLSIAIFEKDHQRAKEECIRRRPQSTFEEEPNWLAVGKAILCIDLSSALNPGMNNPRLVLSEEAGRLVPLTMGTTVRTALYLTLLEMIVSKTEYRTCPNCRKHFLLTRKGKKFCSGSCQNTAKVQRFRAKEVTEQRISSGKSRASTGATKSRLEQTRRIGAETPIRANHNRLLRRQQWLD